MPRGIPNKKPVIGEVPPVIKDEAPEPTPEPVAEKVSTEGMYVSPIKQRVALTSGDVFLFEAKVPQFVREIIRPDMLGYGIMPVDGESPIKETKKDEKVEPVGQKRLDAIDAAMDDIATRNDIKDFAASGIPKAEVVSRIAGFDVNEKVRDKHWKENRQRAAAA